MARKPTGQVIEKTTARGRSFALRFPALGRRQYVFLGYADEGWTFARACDRLTVVMAQVREGEWGPPAPVAAAAENSTFHEFASDWFDARRRELRPTTIAAYEYEITGHLLPFFQRHRLSEITAREVDRYRAVKLRQAEAGARLSNETINKTLARLAQILDAAVDYGMLDTNPARGKRRRLKTTAPMRTHLDRADHIVALLDAARELDREARIDRGRGRRALLATLTFAGLRIGEALDLRWRDVDLATGRLTVGRAKTDAGVREIDLLPALRDELAAHKANARDASSSSNVFGTTTGARQSESNARNRALAKSIERANERLAERGEAPLPDGLTPHSLRRTFASILVALGNDPVYVMDQMGHTDPKFTLKVYARLMRRGADRTALAHLVAADSQEPAEAPFVLTG